MLRADNADLRLTDYALKYNLLPKEYAKYFEAYKEAVHLLEEDENAQIDENSLGVWSLTAARNTAKIQNKYKGYLDRNIKEARALENADKIIIPDGFDPSAVKGILIESKQKLAKIQPKTLGQASRIPGITPSDLQLILINIERFRREHVK